MQDGFQNRIEEKHGMRLLTDISAFFNNDSIPLLVKMGAIVLIVQVISLIAIPAIMLLLMILNIQSLL